MIKEIRKEIKISPFIEFLFYSFQASGVWLKSIGFNASTSPAESQIIKLLKCIWAETNKKFPPLFRWFKLFPVKERVKQFLQNSLLSGFPTQFHRLFQSVP